MSVRELVRLLQIEARDTDVTPTRAAEMALQLSALLGNCLAEIREADIDFNLVLKKCLESEEKANRARIIAETSDEYRRKREARDTKELVTEMIGSLKYICRAASEEARLTR